MKRTAGLVLAFLLLFACAGCTEPASPSTPEPQAQSAPSATPQPPADPGPLRMVWHSSLAVTEEGFYSLGRALNSLESVNDGIPWSTSLYYSDYATMQTQHVPTPDREDGALFPPDVPAYSSMYVYETSIFGAGGYVFAATPVSLERIDPATGERLLLWDAGEPISVENAEDATRPTINVVPYTIDPIACNEQYVYLRLVNTNRENPADMWMQLIRLPVNTEEETPEPQVIGTLDGTILGVWNDEIIEHFTRQKETVSSDEPQWADDYNAEFSAINVNTGEMRVIGVVDQQSNNPYNSAYASNGGIYWESFSEDNDAFGDKLYRLDIATGESSEIGLTGQPQGIASHVPHYNADGHAFWEGFDAAGLVRTPYVVDLTTGTVTPITLTRESTGQFEAESNTIFPAAQHGDDYVVEYEILEGERYTWNEEDGTLRPYEEGDDYGFTAVESLTMYALVSKQDYMAGQANFRPFTLAQEA